jgi:hypothetical protein
MLLDAFHSALDVLRFLRGSDINLLSFFARIVGGIRRLLRLDGMTQLVQL